jgi:serine/threonine-protein kinase HipA
MACGHYQRHANRFNIISGHGRFLLSEEEATAIFDRIADMVRAQWRTEMRRAGVSERDCDVINRAFVYEGLFYGLDG